MAIVAHVEAEPWERAAYLKRSAAERRALTGEEEEIVLVGEEVTNGGELTNERYEELKAREQFILTVSVKGFGKRSSSYDFRTSGRGGKGIRATDTSKTAEIGELVAAFPIETTTRSCSFPMEVSSSGSRWKAFACEPRHQGRDHFLHRQGREGRFGRADH